MGGAVVDVAPTAADLESARNAARLDHVRKLIHQIKAPGYYFVLGFEPRFRGEIYEPLIYMRVKYSEDDVMSGVPEDQLGRRWIIEDDATDMAIVQTAFKAYMTSLEHRAREHFTYAGKAILHPHHSLEELLRVAQPRQHEAMPIPFIVEGG